MINKFEIDFLEEYSQPALIEELKRIQKIVGERSITRVDIDKYGKANWSTYFRKFGSFSKALLAAGLEPTRRMNTTDNDLINSVVELWTQTLEKEGRRPLALDLKKYKIPYCKDTYTRRFGSWKKALILAYNSIDKKESEQVVEKENRPITFRQQREEISIR